MTHRTIASAFAVFASMLIATSAPAQPADSIVIQCRGLDSLFPDERDAALLATLRLLEHRLSELPEQMHAGPEAGRALGIAWELFTDRLDARLRMGDDGMPGIRLASSPTQNGGISGLRARMAGFFESNGLEVDRTDRSGVWRVQTPAGVLEMADSGRGGMIASLNFAGEPDVTTTGLPEGIDAVFSCHVDFAELSPIMGQMAGRDANGAAMLEMMGLLGDDAVSLDVAYGFGGQRLHGRTTIGGYDAIGPRLGVPTDIRLGSAILRKIPRSATYVSASVFDFSWLDSMAELAEMDDAFERFDEDYDFNPKTELLDRIGHRFAMYRSHATGGGGLLSTVLVLELDDAPGFHATWRKGRQMLNALAMQRADGSVRIRNWKLGDVDAYTLVFPGLPVPLQLSFAIARRDLIAAASPESLRVAVRQAMEGTDGFDQNRSFAARCPHAPDELLSLAYIDAQHAAAVGYGWMSLGAAGLANAVRSPTDPDRQPPAFIVPEFERIVADPEPIVTFTRWNDADRSAPNDLVIEFIADRSMLVNGATLAGAMGGNSGGVAGVALATGILLPALGKARESAREVQSMAQLRQLAVAFQIHASEHNDKPPASLDELLVYLGDGSRLSSPFGPAPDGQGDFVLRSDLPERLSRIRRPDLAIMAIDRAALMTGRSRIGVAFCDGHVEQMSRGSLRSLLEQEVNAGAAQGMDLPPEFRDDH